MAQRFSWFRRVALLSIASVGACASDPAEGIGTEGASGSGSASGDDSRASSGDDLATDAAPDDGDDGGPGPADSDSGSGPDSGDTTGDPPPPGDPIAVAVGYGTRRVRSEDGLSWTDFQRVNPDGGDDDDLLRGIGYGDGVFLAVGGAGVGSSMRSLDGIEWTDAHGDLPSFVSDTVWLDGTFVAAGGNGLRMRSLDQGVSWQDLTRYYAGHYRALAAGNGVVVAVGHTYGDSNVGLVSTTTDGAAWTPEQTGGAGWSGGSIAFGGGVFVARDQAGQVRVTADGLTWSEPTLSLGGSGTMLHADGAFVTPGDAGYFTSPDGTRWTELPARFPRDLAGFIEGRFLRLGWPATIDASEDLLAWENVFSPGGSGLTDIAVGEPAAR
jgi:hypothetical protein